MIIDKMVVRFKDKSLLKGETSDFSLHKSYFSMKLLNGKNVRVNIEKMKAAFLVKSFKGNKKYRYTYKDVIPDGGTKVKVEFMDGEVMVGYNPYDIHGYHGFFIEPADLRGNNKWVFVVTSAIKEFTFM